MARTFAVSGSSVVSCSIGGCDLTGDFTVGAMIRRTTDGVAHQAVVTSVSGGSVASGMGFASNNRIAIFSNNGSVTAVLTFTASDDWAFVAVTKAAGTTVGRAHKMPLLSGSWSHVSSVSTRASSGTQAGGTVKFSFPITCFDGDIAYAGIWQRNMSDAELEALPIFSVHSMAQTTPAGFWAFDQDAVTQKVVDWTGNGANEATRTATSVTTGSVPCITYGNDHSTVTRSPDVVPNTRVIIPQTNFQAVTRGAVR